MYYVPGLGFAKRVELCRQHAACDVDEVLAWAVTRVVDGTLCYLHDNDPTAEAMLTVLDCPVLVLSWRNGDGGVHDLLLIGLLTKPRGRAVGSGR